MASASAETRRTIDPERWRRRRRAWAELALLLAWASGTLFIGNRVGEPLRKLGCNVVDFELALPNPTGTTTAITSVPTAKVSGSDRDGVGPRPIKEVARCTKSARLGDALRSSVLWDGLFIVSYVVLLWWCCRRATQEGEDISKRSRRGLFGRITATRVDTSEPARTVARVASWFVLAAGLLDFTEDALLWSTADNVGKSSRAAVTLTGAVAIAKFALLIPAVLVAGRTLIRLALAGKAAAGEAPRENDVLLPPESQSQRWQVPSSTDQDELRVGVPVIDPPPYGICLSGGGIRSATFALGALQVLDSKDTPTPWRLRSARYLSAVSGGSYMAATYQFLARGGNGADGGVGDHLNVVRRMGQAVRKIAVARISDAVARVKRTGRSLHTKRQLDQPASAAPDPATTAPAARTTGEDSCPDSDSPLVPPAGLVENHLRRHSMHLADGAVEWVLALGEIVIRALSGLVILLGVIWTLGLPLGWFYRGVLFGLSDGKPAPTLDGRLIAIPLLAFAAFLVLRYLFAHTADAWRSRAGVGDTTVTREGVRQATIAGVAGLTILAVLLPFLVSDVERWVNGAAQLVGLAKDDASTPSRDNVVARLSTLIEAATTAGSGAAHAAAEAGAGVPAEATDDVRRAVASGINTAELAADLARQSVADLEATVSGDALSELGASTTDASRGCALETAAPTGQTARLDPIALACRAADASASAADAAAKLAVRISSVAGFDATTSARVTAAANEAASGATQASTALVELRKALKGIPTNTQPPASPPVRWAGLSALVTAIGGLVAKRRLDVANRPSGPPSRKNDFTQKLGFGGRTEVLAGLMCLVILIIAFSDVAVDAWRRGPAGTLKLGFKMDAWVSWLGTVGGLGLSFVWINANRWSLRDFYHRRLWLPYAVTPEGRTADWGEVDTRLSDLAERRDNFPELLVCAAVQTSGRQWAPPGRRALPYVFSGAACGGPEVGYVRTLALEALLGDKHRRPITLFGAVATSGAAFGPAMGRQSKGGLGAVLAIANARLGAWLPNPHHLANIAYLGDKRRAGSLSRRPLLAYWFREILGQYPLEAQLVLTTDGGHVENLGLVELLRRRCDRILCFDASGAGATPTTLAEAIIMAREELGIQIDLYGPADVYGHLGSLLDIKDFGADPFRRMGKNDGTLADRLAEAPLLRGRITYPEVRHETGVLRASTGKLIYGSLVLTGDTAWDVLEYAQRNATFPNDGTDKQWFRSNTFTAYQQLGHDVATAMIQIADEPLPEESIRSPRTGAPTRDSNSATQTASDLQLPLPTETAPAPLVESTPAATPIPHAAPANTHSKSGRFRRWLEETIGRHRR